MAFVGGMMGQFMLPIPLNVPVALAVSLFVAYVFTPYLAKNLIKRASDNKTNKDKNSILMKLATKIKKIFVSIKAVSASWKR
jgi:multidrug efflux pump subunit AcrB